MWGSAPVGEFVGGAEQAAVASRSAAMPLRALAVAIGIAWSVAFVLVGLRYDLQMYGDGSIFAYAVAAQDAWTFHWHNISGRVFVYLLAHLPAETYVGLTGDARGGIGLHGLLFFSAPLAGLALTYAADRSKSRLIFVYACLSTACLCPFVFGFPTEMWVAHAVFWPTLAISHYARDGRAGNVADCRRFHRADADPWRRRDPRRDHPGIHRLARTARTGAAANGRRIHDRDGSLGTDAADIPTRSLHCQGHHHGGVQLHRLAKSACPGGDI